MTSSQPSTQVHIGLRQVQEEPTLAVHRRLEEYIRQWTTTSSLHERQIAGRQLSVGLGMSVQYRPVVPELIDQQSIGVAYEDNILLMLIGETSDVRNCSVIATSRSSR